MNYRDIPSSPTVIGLLHLCRGKRKMTKIRIVNNKHELHEPLSGPFTQFRSNLHLVIL